MEFSDWLYQQQGRTYRIAFEALCESIHTFLCERCGIDAAGANELLTQDYRRSGAHGHPAFLDQGPSMNDGLHKHMRRATPERQLVHRAVASTGDFAKMVSLIP